MSDDIYINIWKHNKIITTLESDITYNIKDSIDDYNQNVSDSTKYLYTLKINSSNNNYEKIDLELLIEEEEEEERVRSREEEESRKYEISSYYSRLGVTTY